MQKHALNILMVDDQPNNLKLVTTILKPYYNVSLANDGERAINLVCERKPDLILLDIMMPGLSGFDVCKILKENPEVKNIPIIFLTSLSDSESIEKAYESGGVDYVTKPINSKELLARVRTHLTIKENFDNINRLNNELHISDVQKNKIFSVISHDLINSISGSSQLLKQLIKKSESRTLTAELLASQLLALSKEFSHSNNMLQDLLWWSRNQFKKILLKPEMLVFDILLRKVEQQLEGPIKSKNINLLVNSNNANSFYADPEMLTIVIRNLVSNAIKFSYSGNAVKVDATSQEKDILISVSDYGVGIPKENAEHIFQSSSNLTTPGTNGEKGTGLDLCRGLITNWGGQLWFESEQGKGSTFFFTVPSGKNHN